MKRLALALGIPIAILLAVPAHAGSSPSSALRTSLRHHLFRTLGSVSVPPEWAGIWTAIDSTFDCSGVYQDRTIEDDTLCTGQRVYDSPPDVELTVDCTGSADANEVHAVCTGSGFYDPCTIDYSFTVDGTRTGDTWDIRTEMVIDASGDPLCDFFDDCTRSHSVATRIQPEPVAYCATPVLETTWGQVKSRYR